MRVWIIGLALCLATLVVWANDTRVAGVGGQVQSLNGQATSVHLVREWVRMDVYQKAYGVAVEYVLQNTGPATTVTMGFPEAGSGDGIAQLYRNTTGFQAFHTWLDGKSVRAERITASRTTDGYCTSWTRKVKFAANQTRTVRVEYRATAGYHTNGERILNFNFVRGNWQGNVEESNLKVIFHTAGTTMVKPHTPMTQDGNILTRTWKDWPAEEPIYINYFPITPNALAIQTDKTTDPMYVITQPGKGPARFVLPLAIEYKGMAYVALATMTDFLNEQVGIRFGAPEEDMAKFTWDAEKKQANFTAGSHVLHFTANQPALQIDGSNDVTLAYPPFINKPFAQYGKWTSYMYVPVDPLVQALGGTAQLDKTTRTVTVSISPWWQAKN